MHSFKNLGFQFPVLKLENVCVNGDQVYSEDHEYGTLPLSHSWSAKNEMTQRSFSLQRKNNITLSSITTLDNLRYFHSENSCKLGPVTLITTGYTQGWGAEKKNTVLLWKHWIDSSSFQIIWGINSTCKQKLFWLVGCTEDGLFMCWEIQHGCYFWAQ